MRTPTWKDQNLGIHNGFKIVLSFKDELMMNARYHFINELGWSKEEFKKISNWYWFTAKVTAYMGLIECGDNYLGCCCHSTLKDVLDSELSGYLPDMIHEAIQEAEKNLKHVD